MATARKKAPARKKAKPRPKARPKPAARKAARKKPAAGKAAKRKAAPKARAKPKPKTKPKAKPRPKPKVKPKAKARPKRKASPARKRPARPASKPAKAKAAAPARPPRRKAAPLPASPPPSRTYMSPRQRDWFRRKLESMLEEILQEAEKTARTLREQDKVHADEFDRANSEFAFVVDLRENERISNLQVKINHALRQLEEATYGFCDDCGVEIGIERMTARPVATKCIDCKEFQENLEKHAI